MTRFIALFIAGALIASAGDANALQLPKIDHAATLKECGSCHMVYAPQMLPQRSWNELMGGLDKHFGESAKLDEAVRLDVLSYLLANAADSPDKPAFTGLTRGVAPEVTPVRVTEMPWWLRSHREVNIASLANTRVKTPGNCIGCHIGSDKTMVYREPGE